MNLLLRHMFFQITLNSFLCFFLNTVTRFPRTLAERPSRFRIHLTARDVFSIAQKSKPLTLTYVIEVAGNNNNVLSRKNLI